MADNIELKNNLMSFREAFRDFRATKDVDISLSAIALDEDFYAFMKTGRRVVDGISIMMYYVYCH